MKTIAYFISEHGFGHAARACAVIEALQKYEPAQIHIFSKIPERFFKNSLSGFEQNIKLHPLQSDVGLVQADPFHEDLDLTLKELESFYPISSAKLIEIVQLIKKNGVDLIICDISPLGLLVAESACLPSLLIENFTWDWIYEPYISYSKKFDGYKNYLSEIFESATYHIQTEPICRRDSRHLLVSPIYRKQRKSRRATRNRLGISNSARLLLITMGGISINANQYQLNENLKDWIITIPSQNVTSPYRTGNYILLPHDHHFFHPDLVHASDMVIGKVGYSTIAEVFSAGVPFMYIGRENFRESTYLAAFIAKNMKGKQISLKEFENGSWFNMLSSVMLTVDSQKNFQNGADLVAAFIAEKMGLV